MNWKRSFNFKKGVSKNLKLNIEIKIVRTSAIDVSMKVICQNSVFHPSKAVIFVVTNIAIKCNAYNP